MKNLLLISFVSLFSICSWAQVLYNPFVSNASISPAPMAYSYQGGSAIMSFTFGNSGTTDIPLIQGQPITINITLLRGIANSTSIAGAIAGSMAQYFTWTGFGGAITGTQNQSIPANIAGPISINYRATSNSTIVSPQNGLNVNIGQSPVVAGHNIQGDDNVSMYTYNQQIGLPVELIDFYCDKRRGENLLHWSTLHEVNTDYFTVFHGQKYDQLSVLGTVKATSANNTEAMQYDFSHQQPEVGQHYYQLVSTDLDGKTQIHKTIHLFVQENESLVVSPNPTNNGIYVEYSGGELDMFQIQLFDFYGRLVLDEKQLFPTGEFVKWIPMSHYPNGIYLLKLTNFEGFLYMDKIIKF